MAPDSLAETLKCRKLTNKSHALTVKFLYLFNRGFSQYHFKLRLFDLSLQNSEFEISKSLNIRLQRYADEKIRISGYSVQAPLSDEIIQNHIKD